MNEQLFAIFYYCNVDEEFEISVNYVTISYLSLNLIIRDKIFFYDFIKIKWKKKNKLIKIIRKISTIKYIYTKIY